MIEHVDDLLGTAYAEGRDEKFATPPHRIANDAQKPLQFIGGEFVLPVAVGGLTDEVVTVRQFDRVAQDGPVGAADVAGEANGGSSSVLLDA